MTYAELYLPTLSSPIFSSSCWCTTLYTKHARLTFCLIHNIYTDMYLSSYYISIQHILLFLDTICECVRSNSNFHPQNQDVDFNMLEMFFSVQCAKYDKNRRLNTKLKKKRRNSPKKTVPFLLHYCDDLCTAVLYSDWSLQMGQMGPKMTLGTLIMNGNDFPGV